MPLISGGVFILSALKFEIWYSIVLNGFYTFDGFEYKISYGDQKFKYYYDR